MDSRDSSAEGDAVAICASDVCIVHVFCILTSIVYIYAIVLVGHVITIW